MITEWFLQLTSTVVSWFWSLWPDFTVPDWIATLDDKANVVLDMVSGVAVWAPWGYLIGVAVLCLGTYFVCMLLKYGRAIASYIPFFGGAG